MECTMELLPALKVIILLLFALTFTSSQSDAFRASEKFAARSFPAADPSPGSRVGRPSNRRNVFFPPPDRLSPTLRPIFALQGATETTTERHTTQLSRFHPSSPSKYATSVKKDKTEDIDELYYDYYDDYYYDEPNSTLLWTTTNKPKPKPLPKVISSNSKVNKPPTSFSKFHTGNFRFSAPNRETIPRDTPPSRDVIPSLPPRRTTTASPFRFRFTPIEKNERTTKPSTLPPSNSGRKSLLADLIAQLKTQVNPNDNSNDLDSNREGRILEKPRTTLPPFVAAPTTQKPREVKPIKITNFTESTFSVGSIQSSQSMKGKQMKIPKSQPSPFSFQTTSNPIFQTTEDYSRDSTFTSFSEVRTTPVPPPTVTFTQKTTTENFIFRSEGKRVLEDEPHEDNLTDNISEPEGPSDTKSFSSFFENIQIAVDPSLLPPGYSVEETVTELPEEQEPLTTTSAPKSETTVSEGFSESTIEDLLSSLPQEDVTALLPTGYISSSTEPSFQASSEKSFDVTTQEIFLETEVKLLDSSNDSDSTSSTTEKETSEIKEGDPFSFLSTSHETTVEPNTESELPGVVVHEVDISSFLPAGYEVKEEPKEEEKETPLPGVVVQTVDVSKFLPPGFKLEAETEENETESIVPGPIISTVDVSKFLPPGYKPTEEEEPVEEKLPGVVIKNVDLSAFLPKGYKPIDEPTEKQEDEKDSSPFGDIIKSVNPESFLPPGFNPDAKPEPPTTTETPSTTLKVGKSGIVFPRRPKRPEYLTTTTTTARPRASGPPPVKPKIQNLFDRIKALASTEYKVPVVTEGYKRAQAGINNEDEAEFIPTTPSTTTTTTTTEPTTTTPPVPTTPGICGSDCRLAGSFRLVNGTDWKPELANRDTREFQELSNHIETELDAFFRSSSISLWYDYVEVDSFYRGSVIVSYILVLSRIEADLDTKDLKEKVILDLDRARHTLGNFSIDPDATDFVVIPERQVYVPDDGQNFLIPEWLIAVIVIGLASFLFILIFGVVAVVSRARTRKRASVPLTEEFLNNLNALQGNGIDNYAMNGLYDLDPAWSEKYPEKYPEKAMKPPSSRGKGYHPEYNVNIYDSWRTDYSGPYSTSSANQSKRRAELDFEGSQFYKDDPYDF